MLFFIDESWQTTEDKKYKVGILSAVQISTADFNKFSQQIYQIKCKHLGWENGNIEIKGQSLLKKYFFRLEKRGITSNQLRLAKSILKCAENFGIKVFASVVFEEKEIDLACANVNQLDRPFFFLFERINQFMKESCSDAFASLIFDDRGITTNERISKSVSYFFHRSSAGKSFDRIIKVPFFAISNENVGIQLADVIGHIIGRKYTESKAISEFFEIVKNMQFVSKELVGKNAAGENVPIYGIKMVRSRNKKRAGDLADQE